MIKKLKRYILRLNYKKAVHLIVRICFVIGLILLLPIILNLKRLLSNMEVFELATYILIAVFLMPLSIGILLYLILGVPLKIDEDYKEGVEELKNIFINSNNTTEIIPENSQEHFPKDIFLFYIEQKGVQLWVRYEDSDEFNATIYITDKDII